MHGGDNCIHPSSSFPARCRHVLVAIEHDISFHFLLTGYNARINCLLHLGIYEGFSFIFARILMLTSMHHILLVPP